MDSCIRRTDKFMMTLGTCTQNIKLYIMSVNAFSSSDASNTVNGLGPEADSSTKQTTALPSAVPHKRFRTGSRVSVNHVKM